MQPSALLRDFSEGLFLQSVDSLEQDCLSERPGVEMTWEEVRLLDKACESALIDGEIGEEVEPESTTPKR